MSPRRESAESVADSRASDRSSPKAHHLAKLSAEAGQKSRAARRRQRLKLEMARLFAPEAPETLAVAILPSNEQPIGKLPEARRRAFRDHLTRLIAQAMEQRAAGEGPDEGAGGPARIAAESAIGEERAASDRACATCGGRCCQAGREHAFQTTDDIRRYMAAHPRERPRHLLDAYLSRLPARSYRDSCVYHAETGCVLPREMRSETCNAFHCEEIEEFREDLREASFRRGIALAMRDDEVVRSAFMGEPELSWGARTRRSGATARAPAAGAGGLLDGQHGARGLLRL